MKIFAKGFNFGQDGPGNRLVYHLSGCNMRCIWCSNPEGISGKKGFDLTVDEIVDEVVNSKMLFFSGGGVTFTGGEATLQFDELFELLRKLKEQGIHTTIETNGTSKRLNDLCQYVDYLIMDFKHYDDQILEKYTKCSSEIVKFNFEKNCELGRFQHIRIPLINNINSNNLNGFINYFCRFDTSNTVFEFLPYHEFGKNKWESEYLVTDGFITNDILQTFIKKFEENNLKVIST